MDKILHFGVCFIASFILTFVSKDAGIFFASGLGIGKEYGDSKAVGNHWDNFDLLADGLGLLCGFALCMLIIKGENNELLDKC